MTDVPRWILEAARIAAPVSSWSWMGEHARIPPGEAARPGRYRLSLTPYMQNWAELVTARLVGPSYPHRDPTAHLTQQIHFIKGTQLGGTLFGYGQLGYVIDQHPRRCALVLPRLKDFKRILRGRVEPFFESTPQLARHLPVGLRNRREKMTREQWNLTPCDLLMLCGELEDDLRSFPIPFMFWDEISLLPLTLGDSDGGNAGDPIKLGIERQKTFDDALTLTVTSPKGVHAHGWVELCQGTHERLLVRCTRCHQDQELHPDQLRLHDGTREGCDLSEIDEPDRIIVERLGRWRCRCCGFLFSDQHKDRLVFEAARSDRWVPGRWGITPETPRGQWTAGVEFVRSDRGGEQVREIPPLGSLIRSGHCNSLYSSFISFSKFAHAEVNARRGNRAGWIVHLNGWRCEPTLPMEADEADTLSTEQIIEVTAAGYPHRTAPAGDLVCLVIDQQGNSAKDAWFPFSARSFAPGGESWLIETGVAESWEELEALEAREWSVGGRRLRALVSAMDASNGNLAVSMEAWCARKPWNRSTGNGARGRLLLRGRQWLVGGKLIRQQYDQQRQGRQNSKRRQVARGVVTYHWNVTSWADELDERMRGQGQFPWHLPEENPSDAALARHVVSLTAEEVVDNPLFGRVRDAPQRVWRRRQVPTSGGRIAEREDNHWLDVERMHLVVAHVLEWDQGASPSRAALLSGLGEVQTQQGRQNPISQQAGW